MKPKDDLFKKKLNCSQDFRFDEEVAFVFDDMVHRSIPYYDQIIHMIIQLLKKMAPRNHAVYDLGCSTGTTLIELRNGIKEDSLQYIGVDSSEDMIELARNKVKAYHHVKNIQFIRDDIEEVDYRGAGAVIMNYTLQFIRPLRRRKLIDRIYGRLVKGGILILSEKIVSPHGKLNRAFIDLYYDFKKERGYSELEISNKREALENVLIPCTINENLDLLRNAGFMEVETFFQWNNFVSIIAIK